MTPPPRALDWAGSAVLDRAGEQIGTIDEIFLVEETGRPEWALVRVDGRATLVPLTRAHTAAHGVKVDVPRDVIAQAPEVDADAGPDEQQVDALYRHYGLDAGEPSNGNGAHGAPQPTAIMPPSGGDASPDLRHRPVGDLLKQVSEHGSTLLQQEARLAKAEMGGKVKDVGIGAGMFGGAGYVAHLASLALMLCIVFALATAMPAWLAALVVAVVYGAVAAVLALTAKKRIQQAGPPIPEQTVESVKQTMQTVKEEARWGLGQTR